VTELIDSHFDEDFYLKQYPDIKAAKVPARKHYDRHGAKEGRIPHSGLRVIEDSLRQRAGTSQRPLDDMLELFPSACREMLLEPVLWKRIKHLIHPRLYVAQTMNPAHADVEEAFTHFMAEGAFQGLRPCTFFNADWYLDELDAFNQRHDSDDQLSIEPGVLPFLHWVAIGWEYRIVPTPLFDESYYMARHPDLAKWKGWPFLHYLQNGCFEATRRPSTYVDKFSRADPTAKANNNPLLLQRFLEAEKTWPETHPINSSVSTYVPSHTSFPLESAIIHIARRARKLDSPAYREQVAKAAAIEPLVMHPYSTREVTWLPYKHDAVDLATRGEALRRDLALDRVDTIVLAPHCRMAGSARVTGDLTRALQTVRSDESVLLLTTDLPDFERPDWFAPHVKVFDISRYAHDLGEEKQIRLLLDVLRGLAPRRVINVNSRLGWKTFQMFGKQLSALTDLYSYLFTWDLDQRGNKGGYPISYFQTCFGFLKGVFVDNSVLRDETIWRYALSGPLQDRLHLAHTPVTPTVVDHVGVFEKRRIEKRGLRAFWAGRFDRQKRFDVVIGIAERMPDLEIWVWGKSILGGSGVDFDLLPANIRLQGTYQDFDDLPVESCDFMLYTSEWDGLPTVLLDAAARGVAIVASAVGGVTDLLNDKTAFTVKDILEPEAYVHVISEMLADPAEVTRRSGRLKKHVNELCEPMKYARVVDVALSGSHGAATTAANSTPSKLASILPTTRFFRSKPLA
jgi:glycosyltransferase involved in cell wall biosynthesis